MNNLTTDEMIAYLEAFEEEAIACVDDPQALGILCMHDITITFEGNTTKVPTNADTVDGLIGYLADAGSAASSDIMLTLNEQELTIVRAMLYETDYEILAQQVYDSVHQFGYTLTDTMVSFVEDIAKRLQDKVIKALNK